MTTRQFHLDLAAALELGATAYSATSTSKTKAMLLAEAKAHRDEAARLVVTPPPDDPPPPPVGTITHGRELTALMCAPRTGIAQTFTTRQTINTAGAVRQSIAYLGGLSITAPDVTIKDCTIAGVGGSDALNITGARVHLENVKIDGKRLNYAIKATGNGLNMHRVHMTNAGNGNISLYNPGQGPTDAVITECYVDALTDAGAGFHVDGIESNCSRFRMSRCKILVPTTQTGCINHGIGVTNDVPVFDVEYSDNYWAGGGWAVYIESKHGIRVSGVRVTGNEFGTDFFPRCGYWGPVFQGNRDNLETPVWSNNKFTDGTIVNWVA